MPKASAQPLQMKTFEKRATIYLSCFRFAEYEGECQILLDIGEKWIEGKPLSIWKDEGKLRKKYLDGKNGLRTAFLKGLKEAMNSDDVTGAQARTVMENLWYIHKHGRDKWIEDAKKHRDLKDFYEWPKEGSILLKK